MLAKNRGLRVAARTSAFQFKGKNEDLRGIGRKLNVATVLEGSVRKAGNRVRITAQLVSVADGFHLWSEAYDRELNPDYPNGHQQLGQVHLARSQPEAALREMERETEPLWRRYGLALAFHALGRKKEADAALAELLEKDKEGAAFQIAEVFAFRGEADQAFAWLERAYAQRDPGFSNFKSDPLLEKLAGDARYEAFLEKMRLPLRGGSDPR